MWPAEQALAHSPHEVPVFVELNQRMGSALEHENVATRVDGHPGYFLEIDIGRQLQEVRHEMVVQFWRTRWSGDFLRMDLAGWNDEHGA
jgi:hypothetical protein